MRYAIVFFVVFLATMIAFAFVGNALFNAVEDQAETQDVAGPRPAAVPAPSSGEASRNDPATVEEPQAVVRFVSTADDPSDEDQVGALAAGDEDPSAVASPSDLRVPPAVKDVQRPAGADQKQAVPERRSQVQQRAKCEPSRRRVHRCRLRR